MGALRSSVGALGLAFDVSGAAAWGLAGFFLISALLSTTAGGLIGIAVFVSMLTYTLGARLQETRARALQVGACPRCQASLRREHEHRRWDTERDRWLAPLTTWECAACDYGHSEPVPCDHCPEAAQ